jgi:hypothetical protein
LPSYPALVNASIRGSWRSTLQILPFPFTVADFVSKLAVALITPETPSRADVTRRGQPEPHVIPSTLKLIVHCSEANATDSKIEINISFLLFSSLIL